MDPGVLALLLPIVAIVCFTIIKVTRVRSEGRHDAVGGDVTGRLEALEHEVGALRQELAEAQERLDFAERLLARTPPAKSLDHQ
jgi:hypothetical protein